MIVLALSGLFHFTNKRAQWAVWPLLKMSPLRYEGSCLWLSELNEGYPYGAPCGSEGASDQIMQWVGPGLIHCDWFSTAAGLRKPPGCVQQSGHGSPHHHRQQLLPCRPAKRQERAERCVSSSVVFHLFISLLPLPHFSGTHPSPASRVSLTVSAELHATFAISQFHSSSQFRYAAVIVAYDSLSYQWIYMLLQNLWLSD